MNPSCLSSPCSTLSCILCSAPESNNSRQTLHANCRDTADSATLSVIVTPLFLFFLNMAKVFTLNFTFRCKRTTAFRKLTFTIRFISGKNEKYKAELVTYLFAVTRLPPHLAFLSCVRSWVLRTSRRKKAFGQKEHFSSLARSECVERCRFSCRIE